MNIRLSNHIYEKIKDKTGISKSMIDEIFITSFRLNIYTNIDDKPIVVNATEIFK